MSRWYILFLLLALIPRPQNLDAQTQPHLELQEIIGTGRFTTPGVLVDEQVIVGTQSGVAVYDLTGQHLTTLLTEDEVTVIAVSEELIASGERDGTLSIWHLSDQSLVYSDQLSPEAVKQIVFLTTDIIATTFQNDPEVTVRWIRDNRLLPIRHFRAGATVVIGKHGILTTVGELLKFCNWTFEECRLASPRFKFVNLDPTRVAFSEEAIVIEKWLWKDDTLTQFIDFEPFSIAFLNDEELLIVPRDHAISGETEIFRFNIYTGITTPPLSTARPFKNITAVSPGIFILQSHDSLEIWQNDMLTQKIPAGIYQSDYLSAVGNWIAGGRSTPFLVDLASGSNRGEFRGGTRQLALSPDGTTLLRVPLANQNGVEVWSLEPMQFRTTLWHLGDIGAMAFSGDGQRMATYTNAIRLWDTSTLGALNVISTSFTIGGGLAMNADGTLVAAGAIDGDYRIQVWEGAVPLTTLQGHRAPITKLIFTGEYLVSADESGVIKVWDIFENHVEFALKTDQLVDIDANTNWLTIATVNNVLTVWDMIEFVEIASQEAGYTGQISSLELNDNRVLIASDHVGIISIWEIE